MIEIVGDLENVGVKVVTFISKLQLAALETRILDDVERRIAHALSEHLWNAERDELVKKLDRKLVMDLAHAFTADRLARDRRL